MKGGDVLRIVAGQKSQLNKSPAEAERVHRFLTHMIMNHPELTIRPVPPRDTLRLALRPSEDRPERSGHLSGGRVAAAEEPPSDMKAPSRGKALSAVVRWPKHAYGLIRQRTTSRPT